MGQVNTIRGRSRSDLYRRLMSVPMSDTHLLDGEAGKCRTLAALYSLPDMAAELLAIFEDVARGTAEAKAADTGVAAATPTP